MVLTQPEMTASPPSSKPDFVVRIPPSLKSAARLKAVQSCARPTRIPAENLPSRSLRSQPGEQLAADIDLNLRYRHFETAGTAGARTSDQS